MAANTLSGPHGRDIPAAETAWSAKVDTPLAGTGPVTFHDVLDAMNPLQFLPGVGMIYRAITGDEGNATLRTGVSMVAGTLMGGPLGLLTSIGGSLLEHFFPVEHMVHEAFAPSHPAATAVAAAAPNAGGAAAPQAPQAAAVPSPDPSTVTPTVAAATPNPGAPATPRAAQATAVSSPDPPTVTPVVAAATLNPGAAATPRAAQATAVPGPDPPTVTPVVAAQAFAAYDRVDAIAPPVARDGRQKG